MKSHLMVQSPAAICSGLAARQHGAVATYQLKAALSSQQIRYELHQRDRWLPITGRVFVSTAVNTCDLTRVSVGCLAAGPGTTVSHQTAAALWGIGSFGLIPVHVVRSRVGNGNRLLDLYLPHDSTKFTADDLTTYQGIAVATPARTIFDLAQTLKPEPLKRLVDSAWSMGLVDHWSLATALDRLAKRGRPGISKMRTLVANRGPDWRPPESNLESRLQWLMERACLGSGIRGQVDIGGRTWLGRVDFMHDSGVVIEVQSERHHSSLTSREDDARRAEAIRELGYTLVEVWDNELWHNPDGAIARIQRAIHERHRAA